MIDLTHPEVEFALRAVHQAAIVARQIQAELAPSALAKKDRSPVTIADFAAQAVVGYLLEKTFPEASLVAEKDSAMLRQPGNRAVLEQVTDYLGRAGYPATPERACAWIDRGGADAGRRFWTLDPVDGTKGFLRGEQCVVGALNAFIKLVRAAQSASGRVESRFSEIGLTVSQFGALESLYHLGPLNQKTLAAKILKSTGNITLVLDNLEKRGLVERVRDEQDRRNYSVRITPKGSALIGAFFPGHVARIVKELSALTRAEQDELGCLCKKVGPPKKNT